MRLSGQQSGVSHILPMASSAEAVTARASFPPRSSLFVHKHVLHVAFFKHKWKFFLSNESIYLGQSLIQEVEKSLIVYACALAHCTGEYTIIYLCLIGLGSTFGLFPTSLHYKEHSSK